MLIEWEGKVSFSESGNNLLKFLQKSLRNRLSSRQIKRALEKGGCKVNGRVVRMSTFTLTRNDDIYFSIPEAYLTIKKNQFESERLLYEDDHLFAYDKPFNCSSDDKGILSIIKPYFPSAQLVHRLDRDTTGVLLFAKSDRVYEHLLKMFRQRRVNKEYLVIVDGKVRNHEGVIENYLGKVAEFEGQACWGSVSKKKGFYALTNWKRVFVGKDASLLLCLPKTGRTHQIRVHLSEIGHPILGDFQYAQRFKCLYMPPRYLLHASRLQFEHPIKKTEIVITSSIPDDFMYLFAS